MISPKVILFHFLLFTSISFAQTNSNQPNVLIIIADDLGVDVFNGYHNSALMPSTPTLDSLRDSGILFKNVWATPVCTTTRASIMSGKYGNKTGVMTAPGNLDLTHTSLFTELETQTNNAYSDAVIGKWHISMPQVETHPYDHNVDHYYGILGAFWNAYDDWEETENGITTTSYEYATTEFTDDAIDWINNQNQSWVTWLAHIAPHTPIHLPPANMYTITNTASNFRKYIAMIESFDYEVNRLLQSIPAAVEENTIIIVIGDNGTPNNFTQNYPANHGKGTLYEGGVRVPMIVSGQGVTRIGEVEEALTNVNHIYATVLEIAGANLPGGMYNSYSFKHLLDNASGPSSPYIYTEITSNTVDGCAIRNNDYKLIKFANGDKEFYDMQLDSLEFNDLLTGILTPAQQAILDELEAEADQIKLAWSCNDLIQNGDEQGIDCGGTYCMPCVNGISEETQKNIRIYPNPTTNQINIVGMESDFSIYSIIGVKISDYNSEITSIDISHLSQGTYFIQSENGFLYRFIKE